jgi:DNA replication and repair protein RecF
VSIRRLSVAGFRNLAAQELEPGEGLTVVTGANGSGKTNLLEAITVLGNLASFRPSPPPTWVQHGAQSFRLEATVLRAGSPVELRQEGWLAPRFRRALFRGGRRLGAAEYIELLPVSALSGYDRELVWGGPEIRRRFLDWLSFHLHPEVLPVLQRYRRTLRQRNLLLVRAGRDDEIDAFDHDLARLGALIVRARIEALAGLERRLHAELEPLGWSLGRVAMRYNTSDGVVPADVESVAGRLRSALAAQRRHDRARGRTSVGPHRHDLVFTVQGVAVKDVLSAGQGKLVATGLKLAAMTWLAEAHGRAQAVVFDDIDAELDARVMRRVLARLQSGGQAFLSSAHEEIVLGQLADATVWRLQGGVVKELSRGGNRA